MLTPFAQRSRLFGPRLSRGLSAHQETPALPETGGIPTLRQELPRLAIEIERARRHARPLAVALVSLDSAYRRPDSTLATNVDLYPVLSVLLAQTLREILRQADIVTYVTSQARSVIVLPETSGDGARAVIQRLEEVPAVRLLSPLRTGVAVFPEDGWTFDTVLGHADEEWTMAGVASQSDGGEG